MKLDATLEAIQQLIDQYKDSKPQEVSLDPVAPIHESARKALEVEKSPVPVKKILPLIRKTYKRRISPESLYQALEYRRKRFGDVTRDHGKWSLADGIAGRKAQ